VAKVEFSLVCPIDGQLEFGLEDITAVVFRDPESIDLCFECPRCGATLQTSLHVPGMLAAAMNLAHQAQLLTDDEAAMVAGGKAREDVRERRERERVADAYCEYFRRQLAHVDYVDDLLAEVDGR